MITVTLHRQGDLLAGFTVEGHAFAGQAGSDTVCAAVSSAAYLTANTITENMALPAQAEAQDAFMRLLVRRESAGQAQALLRGFEYHVTQLREQYPQNIQIQYGGVEDA